MLDSQWTLGQVGSFYHRTYGFLHIEKQKKAPSLFEMNVVDHMKSDWIELLAIILAIIFFHWGAHRVSSFGVIIEEVSHCCLGNCAHLCQF